LSDSQTEPADRQSVGGRTPSQVDIDRAADPPDLAALRVPAALLHGELERPFEAASEKRHVGPSRLPVSVARHLVADLDRLAAGGRQNGPAQRPSGSPGRQLETLQPRTRE